MRSDLIKAGSFFRFVLLCSVTLTACPATAAERATAKFEAPPVSMPEPIAAHVPSDLRSYYLGFYVAPPSPKKMPQELFVRHQAYLRAQVEAGIFQVMGPLTDEGRLKGLIILSAPSLEEAKRLISADPAVQEGVFAVEAHPVVLPNLAGLKIAYPPSTAAAPK